MINRYLHDIFIQFDTFYVKSIPPPSGIFTEICDWHPPLHSDCCCGLACCRFGHRKGQSSNSSQAWGFFHTYVTRIYQIQMVGTVCNECLGDISAWQEADFSFTRRQINKLNEEVIAGLRKIGSFSRICSFKNFLGRGKTKLKRVTCPHYSQIQLGTMYFLSSLSSLA